jgi:hypothetical protein
LNSALADVLEDGSNEMNALARQVIAITHGHSGASSTLTSHGATSASSSTPQTTPRCAAPHS